MSDEQLIDFLRARLQDDTWRASEALQVDARTFPEVDHAAHQRWAELNARRLIMDLLQRCVNEHSGATTSLEFPASDVLALMTMPYADSVDFQPQWQERIRQVVPDALQIVTEPPGQESVRQAL
ncbi:MAG: hypothetical protein JWN95_1207 [Frankiales bacterium]|nr:hypothetical protein [Frankiales bacterium]